MSLPHESTAPTAKRAGYDLFIRRRSHDSDEPGIVAHSVRWIDDACTARGLLFEISTRIPVKENGQVWAVATKPADDDHAKNQLLRSRAQRALRGIRHHVKSLKFMTAELTEALKDEERSTVNPRDSRKHIKAIKSASRALRKRFGVEDAGDGDAGGGAEG